MHVEDHSSGLVAGDCLKMGGQIIEKLHQFFFCLLGDFFCLAAIVFGVTSISGSTAPIGALWTRNLVLSTGAASDVVWLRWVVRICGVRLSRSLKLR